jgi:hypothetical protein
MGLIIEKRNPDDPKNKDFLKEFFEQAFEHHKYSYYYVDPSIDEEAIARAFAKLNSSREPIVFFGDQQDFSKMDTVSAIKNSSSVQYFNNIVPSMVGRDYNEEKKLTFLLPL